MEMNSPKLWLQMGSLNILVDLVDEEIQKGSLNLAAIVTIADNAAQTKPPMYPDSNAVTTDEKIFDRNLPVVGLSYLPVSKLIFDEKKSQKTHDKCRIAPNTAPVKAP
jgi:hypothetical protein